MPNTFLFISFSFYCSTDNPVQRFLLSFGLLVEEALDALLGCLLKLFRIDFHLGYYRRAVPG